MTISEMIQDKKNTITYLNDIKVKHLCRSITHTNTNIRKIEAQIKYLETLTPEDKATTQVYVVTNRIDDETK